MARKDLVAAKKKRSLKSVQKLQFIKFLEKLIICLFLAIKHP